MRTVPGQISAAIAVEKLTKIVVGLLHRQDNPTIRQMSMSALGSLSRIAEPISFVEKIRKWINTALRTPSFDAFYLLSRIEWQRLVEAWGKPARSKAELEPFLESALIEQVLEWGLSRRVWYTDVGQDILKWVLMLFRLDEDRRKSSEDHRELLPQELRGRIREVLSRRLHEEMEKPGMGWLSLLGDLRRAKLVPEQSWISNSPDEKGSPCARIIEKGFEAIRGDPERREAWFRRQDRYLETLALFVGIDEDGSSSESEILGEPVVRFVLANMLRSENGVEAPDRILRNRNNATSFLAVLIHAREKYPFLDVEELKCKLSRFLEAGATGRGSLGRILWSLRQDQIRMLQGNFARELFFGPSLKREAATRSAIRCVELSHECSATLPDLEQRLIHQVLSTDRDVRIASIRWLQRRLTTTVGRKRFEKRHKHTLSSLRGLVKDSRIPFGEWRLKGLTKKLKKRGF